MGWMNIDVCPLSDRNLIPDGDESRPDNMDPWKDVNIPTIMSKDHPVPGIFNVSPKSFSHNRFTRSMGLPLLFIHPPKADLAFGYFHPFSPIKIISLHYFGGGANR